MKNLYILFLTLLTLTLQAQTTTLISETLTDGSNPSGWTINSIEYHTSSGGYARFQNSNSSMSFPVNTTGYENVQICYSVAKYGGGTNGPLTFSISAGAAPQTFTSATPMDATYSDECKTITVSGALTISITRLSSPSQKRLKNVTVTGEATSPVSFSKVMGEYKNKETEISWSTASETNNAYFEVEKSIDGKEFTAIGTVQGAGNSTSERHYTFIDQQPDPIAYYRVKQVDYDGKSSHSSIVLVRGDTLEAIHLRNTIVDDYLYINCHQQSTVHIFNQNGQGKHVAVLQSGSNTIDMEQFNAGIYFVAINDGQRVYTSRIVKR